MIPSEIKSNTTIEIHPKALRIEEENPIVETVVNTKKSIT